MSRPADMSFWAAGAWFFWDLAKYLLITAAVFAAAASALLLMQYALMAALLVYVMIAASASFMALPLAETLVFFGLAATKSLMISSVVISLSGLSAGLSGVCQLGDYLFSCNSSPAEPSWDLDDLGRDRYVFN